MAVGDSPFYRGVEWLVCRSTSRYVSLSISENCPNFQRRKVRDFSENQEILFTHGYEFLRVYGEDCIYRLKR